MASSLLSYFRIKGDCTKVHNDILNKVPFVYKCFKTNLRIQFIILYFFHCSKTHTLPQTVPYLSAEYMTFPAGGH